MTLRRKWLLGVVALGLAMGCQGDTAGRGPQPPDEMPADAARAPAPPDARGVERGLDAGTDLAEGRPDGMAPADAGPMSADAALGPPPDMELRPPTGGVFVAVGYAGRRIRSRDLGVTWEDDQTLGGGGDDEFLLRAVTHGRGVFVAVGWKILTSSDGKTWTERPNPSRQWLGGVRYGNDRFAAVGGFGYSAVSTDGLVWMRAASRGTEAARSLAFGNGKFVGATDPGTWWTSTDAQAWQRGEAGHSSRVVWCGDAFSDAARCSGPAGRNGGRAAFGGGVWVAVRGGSIERSTDGGATWKTVRTGGVGLEDVAFGPNP